MFERIFGKKTTESLLETIAEKSAEKIAKDIAEQSRSPQSTELQNLAIKKVTLEIAALEAEKQKREKESLLKTEALKQPTFEEPKKRYWHQLKETFSVKGEISEFSRELSSKRPDLSIQAYQGVVQAFGQMRAGKITARGAAIATGILGFGLWVYQQQVRQDEQEAQKTKKQAEEILKDLKIRQQELEREEKETKLLEESHSILTGELEGADLFVKEICKDDTICLQNYSWFKTNHGNLAKIKYENVVKELENLPVKLKN